MRAQRPTQDQRRHILVVVAGQTPQIVTETLYALMIRRRPPLPIREIYVITTSRGADVARRALLDPSQEQFFAFCREYGIDHQAIAFDAAHIITIKKIRQDGRATEELDDIRTVADNRALAQQIFGFLKQLTADPQTALHCSIAGGRKTMSAYLALALTLYGRKQDTLSHVLVPEIFESNAKFFFPPRRSRSLPVRRGQDLDIVHTKDAHIELAEIPFVRLRERMGEWFPALDQTVEEAIQTAQHTLDLSPLQAERLILDPSRKSVRLGDTTLPLHGIQLALFAYFADTKASHCTRPDLPTCDACTDCYQEHRAIDFRRFAGIYRRFGSRAESGFDDWLAGKRKKQEDLVSADNFMSYVSRINRALKDLGASQGLAISSTGGWGSKRYGLGIDKTRIEVKE